MRVWLSLQQPIICLHVRPPLWVHHPCLGLLFLFFPRFFFNVFSIYFGNILAKKLFLGSSFWFLVSYLSSWMLDCWTTWNMIIRSPLCTCWTMASWQLEWIWFVNHFGQKSNGSRLIWMLIFGIKTKSIFLIILWVSYGLIHFTSMIIYKYIWH